MSKTALLLMDVQNGTVSGYCNDPDFISRIQKVKAAAHTASVPVIYVVIKFREQFPEVSPHNKIFAALKAGAFPLNEGNPAAEVCGDLAPEPSEIVVSKRRVSAFSGSDLQVVLRAQEVNHIVLAGITTSGVVLSTLREAADMDYEITVLSDCCFDKDEEVHKVLMEKVFPMQSEVMTAKQWGQQLSQPPSVVQFAI